MRDVGRYVEGCDLYQRMKNQMEELAEKLKLSEVLEKLWTHLIVDFITKLPVVTNFIQLISPQPVDRFSQTKLRWKALNEGHPHIYGMYKSNNERLRYQAISSCKSFVC